MAILVTTLCELADKHGGSRRPTAAMWPHSRRRDILQSSNTLGNKFTSLNLENIIVIYTIMTITGTARRACHLAIWPKMSRLGPTMMISTAPNWRRPQSGCQESASRFDTVETSYSTSNDDRSTGVLINRCCNCWAYRTKFYGGENGGAEFGEQKNYGLTFVTRHPYPHRHRLSALTLFVTCSHR